MTIDHSDGLRTLLPPLALTIPSFSVGSCPTPMSVFPKVAPGTSPGDSSARNVLGAFSSPMRKSSLYFTFPDAIQSPMVARNSASCSWKTASPGCAAAPPACKHKTSGFRVGALSPRRDWPCTHSADKQRLDANVPRCDHLCSLRFPLLRSTATLRDLLRHQATPRHARAGVQQWKHCRPHVSTHILKICVSAIQQTAAARPCHSGPQSLATAARSILAAAESI